MAADALHHAEQFAHHAAGATTAHHDGGGMAEIPNFVTLLASRWHEVLLIGWLHHWENLVFSGIVGITLCAIAWRWARRPALVPSQGQAALEMLVGALDHLVQQVIGPSGRRHTPFIGTLFVYIWFMNLSGLIPGMKSATSSLNTTIGLALVVFGYVQWVGLTANGPLTYLDHLAGSPRDLVGWLLVPLMLPIHLIGEFVKPLSLSLRLGFNVFAEDVLLAQLLLLGLGAGALLHLPIGLPLQALVIPLVLIFSTVQALVFSLLSSVYIGLMTPHGEHH